MVHRLSLKIGNANGLWQYKLAGTHEKVVLHSLRHILDSTCQLLGFGRADRSVVYLFSFSSEPFPGCQVCLERLKEVREGHGTGCFYRVSQSTIGDFRAQGLFPAVVNATYFSGWPERIFFKLERSLTGEIVN